MKYLPEIEHPDHLKAIREADLPELCSEIRAYLESVVPEVGGHFASSLGAVDLTVALHYVYDTFRDKICWDVGHQGYPWKVFLTICYEA